MFFFNLKTSVLVGRFVFQIFSTLLGFIPAFFSAFFGFVPAFLSTFGDFATGGVAFAFSGVLRLQLQLFAFVLCRM